MFDHKTLKVSLPSSFYDELLLLAARAGISPERMAAQLLTNDLIAKRQAAGRR